MRGRACFVVPSGVIDLAVSDYRLAAVGREADEDERLTLLEQLFDSTTRRRRAVVRPGWRRLEVGGGRGSMAAWLAEQVGPTGHVVATDLNTGYLRRLDLPNLEVFEHNILEDSLDALGPGSFDLVCSRLMLFHLVGRQEQAIRRMTECLRPGGWLIDEDADWGTCAPVDPTHPLYDGYQRGWRYRDWWTVRGYDKTFGRRLPALFERCGLQDIRHEAATEAGARRVRLGALVGGDAGGHERAGWRRRIRPARGAGHGRGARPSHGLVPPGTAARLLGQAARLGNSALREYRLSR